MSQATTLPLRAENNPKFYSRFKWLGLGALAFMAYSVYDGFIRYPAQMERSEAFYELVDSKLSDEQKADVRQQVHGRAEEYQAFLQLYKKSDELQAAWAETAQAETLPPEPFSKLRTQADIYSNYIFAALGLVAGVWFLTTVARTNGRWIELNGDGITSRWGESFSLDQVAAIEKKQWRDKGIAYLRYRDAKGRSRRFLIDNYKYHRPTTERILYEVEQRVGTEKIQNGYPEVDPDAPPVEAEAAPPVAEQEAANRDA
ncbi:hypothetical protein [Botrimarina sp.]|uniref:hypothetical protein n=1 Tax=Botrimarina sp. TaxID=2795802 RepID=UPI0032EBFD77